MSQQKVPIDEDQHTTSENTSQQKPKVMNPPFNESTNPEYRAEINNENKKAIFFAIIMFIGIFIIAILLNYFNPFSCPNTCDMKMAENRDFNRYYGIMDVKSHFATPTADGCDSNVIFRATLPQTILKPDNSASSFVTVAKYGAGKTLIRCEYFKSLQSDKYLKVLILNKQISEYLERYAKGKFKDVNECENQNCLYNWKENEFAQLLLSTLVTEFINLFQHQKIKLTDTSIEEKIELITILCFYYNGFGTSKLENFINYYLDKSLWSMYRSDNVVVQIKEKNVAQDKPLLVNFKKDLQNCHILKQEYLQLHLLLAVVEGEGFQNRASSRTMYENVLNDLTHFSIFIKKHINRFPVFVIDGIDENQYFFQKITVNKASIESFYRSSVSPKILSKVMANDFYLSIFYPKIDGINIQDGVSRKDKFPEHAITWTTKSLINYADYVLQEMNKNTSRCYCQLFTDFKTLVNYSNKRIAEIINKIPTPRALHYFMNELIREMNNDAGDIRKPFKATFENVHIAYEKSYGSFDKIHQINE